MLDMTTMRGSTRLSSGSRRSRRHAGSLARAARLTGAAKAHQARHGFVDEETVWSRLVDDIAPARDRYGPERWDLAEREGAALSVHDAIDLALERGRFARVATTTTAAAPR